MVQAYQEGKFLAEPEMRGKPRPNPMSDPAAMEGMMGMMKGNMAMMIPQTLIMGWINAFFSGFVISKSGRTCRSAMLSGHSRSLHDIGERLLIALDSETPLPVDTAVQVYAPVWCRNSRLGREMGVQFVLVLPHSVRTAACVQLHPRQQQW